MNNRGSITNNIANIIDPQQVSLANNPNHVVFKNKNTATPKLIEVQIKLQSIVPGSGSDIEIPLKVKLFTITQKSNKVVHSFSVTTQRDKVDNTTFFFDFGDASISAESLRECLIQNSFLREYYNLSIPPVVEEDGMTMQNGDTIYLQAKGAGAAFEFTVAKESFMDHYIIFKGDASKSPVNDTISQGKDCTIILDVYKNTKVKLGENSLLPLAQMGSLITSLSKSYFGEPIWFDINAIMNNEKSYSNAFLKSEYNWCNTGTVNDIRFVAKRNDGHITNTFYYSDVIYSITGYKRNLERYDLEPYIISTNSDMYISPLTTRLNNTHVRGQKQYFNFILSQPNWKNTSDKYSLAYRFYTQSGGFLREENTQSVSGSKLDIVNTIRLMLDPLIDKVEGVDRTKECMCGENCITEQGRQFCEYNTKVKVGKIEVYLCRNNTVVSHPMCYNVLPANLHTVYDFAFINSLGGWSSFNFEGMQQTEYKGKPTTYHRMQTPYSEISDSIETVYNVDIEDEYTVQTAPLQKDVIEWLTELTASPAVYELATMRYVLVDEFVIKPNSKDDLFTLTMKYRYSDSFNSQLK